jgi:hypothetical protein
MECRSGESGEHRSRLGSATVPVQYDHSPGEVPGLVDEVWRATG